MSFEYPEFIKKLPQADIPFDGIRGYLLSSEFGQVVFFEIDPIGKIPEHSHSAQWGFVIEGSMRLSIGGKSEIQNAGSYYYIPAGVRHSAEFLTKFYVVDIFADSNRYKIKKT
ncbi:MAG: hypothetical protein CO189_07130 [candidate division Zixibacteria bacterium CG_4_9_14_3_um_filter_46_8]|nr:MAG: hypothetical protein CO189_07130 [candidate division Zixibacteria bacterium CG_4_9_14_3_um_filter_46_8]